MDGVAALARARLALEGLSVGDAFGERYFKPDETAMRLIERRTLAVPPWHWTDDTAMAVSILEVLQEHGRIDQDQLARCFAERFTRQPGRGYGATAQRILHSIAQGVPWSTASGSAFRGKGSMGNGAAMRAAVVGAYFAEDVERVVEEARASAEVTHAHPDGMAGAVAVAVAAAMAWRLKASEGAGDELLSAVIDATPSGDTREGLICAARLAPGTTVREAAGILGSGFQVLSSDTVPFAIWSAARNLHNYEEALWRTVAGLGDRDTTCAIAGGIVVMGTGLEGMPRAWREAREPLPVTLS